MPSVIDQQPFNEYAGNGVTTLFAYEFQILAAEDMVVRVDGVTIPSSSYTLTGVGVQAGGTVEFGAAPANGTTVLLSREMALERDTDYQEQGDLLADTVNNDFNRLWLAFQEFYSGGRGVPTALRVPLGESIDPLPVAADRDGYLLGFAGGSWVLVPGQSGTATSLALDLANTAFGKGASMIGLQDAADYFASATVEGAIAELGLAKKKLVDVSAYPWLADMTGATDSSAKVFAAQTYAQSIGAGIYIPPGTLLAGIDIHYNNAVIIGAGSYLTRIKLPTSTVAITSIATASNVLTVQCASTSTLWVGRSIRITGTTASAHNSGFIVTSVDSATQFKCQQLNTTVTGSSTGGNFSAANVIDCGRLCDGNLATAYSGLVLRGFTVDGMRGTRPTPTSDLTDWGIALTNFTKFNITDVRGVDCWNAGIAAFINSNYGHAQGQVENCGFSSTNPAGFDINSSKHFTFDIVSKDCKNGIRLLDNCWDIVGRATIQNATTIGAVFNNQTLNESHNCIVHVTVEGGCTSDGVQIGTNFRNSTFVCNVSGVTGIGVREVYVATAANRPGSNRVIANTRQCGLQGAKPGGDGSVWECVSYQDGRTGSAGSVYAVEIDGQRNIVKANITDSSTPQVRGVSLTATSASNRIEEFVRNTLVSDYNDSGSSNTFTPRQLRGSKTFDCPSLAAGAQTSTTITVTGATTGSGDVADVRYSNGIGGILIYAEVTAADTVTAWLTNLSGGVLDPASSTIYATVMKGTP